jgi:pyruvate formate lyase activating enzyme
MHIDLPEFLAKIRQLGFKIKLDTNGTNPELLTRILNEGLVDYLAMDVKASPGRYDLVAGVQPDLENIRQSIKIIKDSSLPYEFRTTMVPELVTEEDIHGIGQMVQPASRWYLQKFQGENDLVNQSFRQAKGYTDKQMEHFCELGRQYANECDVR